MERLPLVYEKAPVNQQRAWLTGDFLINYFYLIYIFVYY